MRSTGQILRAVCRDSVTDRVSGLAAEMGFFGALGFFPGLMVVAGLIGSYDRLTGGHVAAVAEGTVVRLLGQILSDQASAVTLVVRDLFARERGGLVTSALIISVWAMSRGFAAAVRALDLAYGLKERRTWIDVRIRAFLLAVGSALMVSVVLAVFTVGPLFGHGRHLAGSLGLGPAFAFLWDWVRGPATFALVVVWMTTIYRFGPNHDSNWREGLPGALAAGVAWLGLAFGFRASIHVAGQVNRIFGMLGGGLVALTFIYLLSLTLLLGGELNAVLAKRRGSIAGTGEEGAPARDRLEDGQEPA
jgi:membrane protein